MQQGKLDGRNGAKEKVNPAGAAQDNVDALVSSFLEELAAISSEAKQTQQLEIVEKAPVDNIPAPEQAFLVPEMDKKVRSESGLDLEDIRKELEDSLNELERLKAKVIPITDRKDPRPESSAPARTEVKAPADSPASEPSAPAETKANVPADAQASASWASAKAKMNVPVLESSSSSRTGVKAPANASAAKARVKSVEPPAIRESDEQAWNRLELFRSQIVSRKPFPWLKSLLWIAILACILGIPAYKLYTQRSNQTPLATDAAALPPGSAGQALGSKTEVPQNPAEAGESVKAESISEMPPVYPPSARRRKITGTVVLEADISENGDVLRVKTVSGPAALRTAAEEALMQWKFKPASADGVNIASKERISIDFRPLR